MTREEQIMKKVNEVCNDPNNDWKSTWDLCQMIAEWADQTMLDKVCKWLENTFHDRSHHSGRGDAGEIVTYDFDSMQEFILKFRKAMKEQQ